MEHVYDDEAKITRLVKELGEAFIARRDVKAIQADGGEWLPVRKNPKDPSSDFMPFTMMDFKAHLSGDYSLGHYLLDTENQTKLFAFDLDVVNDEPADGGATARDVWLGGGEFEIEVYTHIASQLATVAEALALAIDGIFEGEVRVAICDTGGKGLHVYGLTGLQPASVQRQLATGVLEELTLEDGSCFKAKRGNNFFRWNDTSSVGYPHIEVEVFPKQDELQEGGLGNLLALPVGVNRKTGHHRPFVRLVDDVPGWVPIDPIEALTADRAWKRS